MFFKPESFFIDFNKFSDAIRRCCRPHGKYHDPLSRLLVSWSVQNDHCSLWNPVFLPFRWILGPSLFKKKNCKICQELLEKLNHHLALFSFYFSLNWNFYSLFLIPRIWQEWIFMFEIKIYWIKKYFTSKIFANSKF